MMEGVYTVWYLESACYSSVYDWVCDRYRCRKIPIIIRRYLPDGSYEDWGCDELIITDWARPNRTGRGRAIPPRNPLGWCECKLLFQQSINTPYSTNQGLFKTMNNWLVKSCVVLRGWNKSLHTYWSFAITSPTPALGQPALRATCRVKS